MRIQTKILLAIICLLICVTSLDLSAQKMRQDTVGQLMASFSPFSFAGKYPSLQGGLFYRLDTKSAIDAELSYLYRKNRGDIRLSLGLIIKAGYLYRIGESNNHLVSRLYLRNGQFLGREEFSRYGGEYIERIDFNTTTRSLGLTVGGLRHVSGDVCDFQFGLSFGVGKLFRTGGLPQDAELITNGWTPLTIRNESIPNNNNYEGLFYADFKFMF